MDRGTVLGILIVALMLALSVYLFLPKEAPRGTPFVIKGDLSDLAVFLQEKNVVVRAVYPFRYPGAVVSAVTYVTAVMTAKGHTVIIEYVDGNTCYTNEGNVLTSKAVSVEECNLPYPTIELREGYPTIEVGEGEVVITGPSDKLFPAASYLLKKIYPDADEVYHRVMSMVEAPSNRLSSERSARPRQAS